MSQSIKTILDSQRSRANRRLISRRMLVGLFLFTCLLVCFAWLDYTYIFSIPARFAVWTSLLASMAAVLASLFLVATPSRKQVAQSIEARVDTNAESSIEGTENASLIVTTSADIHAREALASEPEFGAGIQEKLDEQATQIALNTKIRPRARLFPWFAAICLVAVLAVQLGNQFGTKCFSRILAPWFPQNYTNVVIERPTGTIVSGMPFQIQGRLDGRLPTEAWLHTKSHPDSPVPVEFNSDGSYSVELSTEELRESYWVVAGDGISDVLDVAVFKPAEVAGYKIDVLPPAYAANRAEALETPNIEVLRASSLTYEITVSNPVASVRFLKLENQTNRTLETIQFQKTEDPLVYRLAIDNVVELLNYRISITRESGETSSNDEPFKILPLPDFTPKLTITSHNGKKVLKKGNEKVQVNFKATDDIGLESLRLVYRKIGTLGETRSIPLDQKSPTEYTVDSLLEMAPLNLQPQDLLVVFAEGQDGNILDGPGVGTSQVVMIEVPKPPAPKNKAKPKRGGGGGGGPQTVNPLEIQKSLLRDTSMLGEFADSEEYKELRQDQLQVNKFVELMLQKVNQQIGISPRAAPIAAQLQLAISTMNLAERQLGSRTKRQSLLAQEFAVATLSKAAKMMGGPT